MKVFFLIAFLSASAAQAAPYGSDYFQADFWSGEYPAGFSVVERGVKVPARKAMDLELAQEVSCELPYRAVYHPWNARRKAVYHTASKIIPLTATKNFSLGEEGQVEVQAGEVVEYLIYQAEGMFLVRYKNELFTADQGMFDAVAGDTSAAKEDQWLQLRCVNGPKAWIFLPDLQVAGADGEIGLRKGLDSWSRGLRAYGKVTDLTAKDLSR